MSMNPPLAPAETDDRAVTIRDFYSFLARNRWLLVAGISIFAGLTLLVAEVLPPKFTTSVTLVPASSSSHGAGLGAIASAASQFSGIASLAGIHIGETTGTKAVALATLKSRLLLNTYIEKHNLMPVLFPKDWSQHDNHWRFSDAKLDPTLWDADQLFDKDIRTITSDQRTGVVTLTISWRNPNVAAQWANGLVALTNSYLRQEAILHTQKNLAYLQREISKTDVVAVKNAISSLMEQEIKQLMVATGRKQFAFRVVDPAIPPSHKSSPRPLLWTLGGAVAGAFVAAFVAMIRETLADDENKRERLSGAVQDNDGI